MISHFPINTRHCLFRREGSYQLWQLKEKMNNQLLLPFFVINLFTSLFAADEVNTLALKRSSPLENYFQPALPQLNIKYNPLPSDTNHTEYLQRLLNFEKDGSTYCPHIEILTRILNKLRNSLPQFSDKIKDVLSSYYKILENALNNKYGVETVNQISSEDRLHHIDSLAQKIIMMDDKNAKIKISFEYELPTMHKTMCEKLCNNLINYANAENLTEIHDLNNEQDKMKNNIMTFLQNYRPDNINPKSSSYIKFNITNYLYPPNSVALPLNPVSPNLPVSNPLQSMTQSPLNQKGIPISDPLQNFAPLFQSPIKIYSYSKENVTHIPPLSRPTGNANLPSSQNFAYQFQINPKIPYLASYNLQNLALQMPSLIGTTNTAKYSSKHLSPQWLEPKSPSIKSPFQNSIQSFKEISNSYPFQNLARLVDTSFHPLQIVEPPLPNLKENSNYLQNTALFSQNPIGPNDSYSIQSLPPQLQSLTENAKDIEKLSKRNSIPILQNYKGSSNSYPFQNFAQLVGTNFHPLQILAPTLPNLKGNINSLENAELFSQDPIGPEDSYPIQSLPPQPQSLTENAKDIEKLPKQNYDDYRSYKNYKYIHNNKINAAEYVSKNNLTVLTPTKPENRWSPTNDVSTNNKYSNNEKLPQEMLIQTYNQYKIPALNIVPEANKQDSVNLYHSLNKNYLPSIKPYEIGKLEMDSSSAQASSLDLYKQYLQSVKNLINPQTNTRTGYFLNPQVSPPPNFYQLSHEKNNVLYNSYVKKNNQLATQYDIPNRLALYQKLYNYHNPNLDITNTAKDIQENYSVQFQDLNRLLGVSNHDKLNSVSSKNGIVELTYKLNHSNPSDEPYFYVKYRLPYDIFMFNFYKLLFEKPDLRHDLQLLYKDLLIGSNITSSSVFKNLDKDELLRLVSANGTLVTAKVLNAKDSTASEQIKIVQRLNADMPLKDIVKIDANITKVSDLTSNIHLINYLKDRLNYLDDLQRNIALKQYYLNPYDTQANQNYYQYVQYPTYLANRKPSLLYNYLQTKQNYPYPQYGLNSFIRYFPHRG